MPRAAARLLDADPAGGAAFHDRLGDVLGAVEGAAGVNPVPERGGGLKAAGFHKVVGTQRDIQLFGQSHHIRGNHHAHGEDDHVKNFVLDLAGFEDVPHLQVAVMTHGGDGVHPGADQAGSLVLDAHHVFFKIFPGGAHIHIEQGHIQVRPEVFPGDGRLFQGYHAAEIGAVGVLAFLVAPHAHAMEPGDSGGLFAVGPPDHVAVIGAAGAQDALKLQAGIDIGEMAVAVGLQAAGIKGFKTGRQDDRPHLQGDGFIFLLVINGAGGTNFGAEAAVAGEQLDAVLGVDGGGGGHRLGVETGNVPLGHHLGIEFGEFRFGSLAADGRQVVDMPGRTHEEAGPAGAAGGGKIPEGGHDLAFGAPAHHGDGGGMLDFMAHPHAFAAQDTVALALGVSGFGQAQLLGHDLEGRNFRAPGQEQIHDKSPGFLDFFGVGLDGDPFGHRIGAGRGELGAGPVGDFHHAEAAAAVGFEALEMAQGGNREAQLAGGLEDRGPFRNFNGPVVDRQVNHRFFHG